MCWLRQHVMQLNKLVTEILVEGKMESDSCCNKCYSKCCNKCFGGRQLTGVRKAEGSLESYKETLFFCTQQKELKTRPRAQSQEKQASIEASILSSGICLTKVRSLTEVWEEQGMDWDHLDWFTQKFCVSRVYGESSFSASMTYILLLKTSISTFWKTRRRPLICKIRNVSYSHKLFSIFKSINKVQLNITLPVYS